MENEVELVDNEEREEEKENQLVSDTEITYRTEDFISEPRLPENGTVPKNILEFDHSFGYDCQKRFNLCVADPDTLIFASGNLLHFYHVPDKKITYRRSYGGLGIGHITKNPTFDHIAVGENGTDPPIIIYEWPSMEIVTVLREGTTRAYSHLRYSPDGLQLVSQGGDPDYLITIWDWKKSKIALQCKSHGQDVYNVVFSPTMTGHMTSCGSGHIKSWKMSSTFTGLKLQGELGRFGKTEISDILGVYSMPDEKVISGCEWGNILVWDEGLIKIEVRRKNQKPCHRGYISQFEYNGEELITIGTDGSINFWYYDSIDQAEPTEDSHYFEVEPIYELFIKDCESSSSIDDNDDDDDDNDKPYRGTTMLMQILKQKPNDPGDAMWYAQDGNGGIWLFELSMAESPKPTKKLLSCHAGPVMGMDVADWGPYAATIGRDGCLNVYDYREKKLLITHRFEDRGACIVWLPCSIESSGSTLICAFITGVIRMVSIDLTKDSAKTTTARLIQVLKPHNNDITCMSTNPSNTILVTGSEDSTIFVFHIDTEKSYPNLIPIGYLKLPSSVTFVTWKPDTSSTIFVGCSRGYCTQVDLPEVPQAYTTISYELTECRTINFKFESVKSAIIREQVRSENEIIRQEKIAEKRAELEKIKQDNPNMEIDELAFIESGLGEEKALPEIYIPEVPNSVLMAIYTSRDTLLLSIAGYDAGYAYEYSNPVLDQGSPTHVNSHLVVDCSDAEIRSFVFYNERKYIIFGMSNGELRVSRINPRDEADFSDYWILPMHDNYNGHVSSVRLSYDDRTLLTSGHDGNLFSFAINDDSIVFTTKRIPETKINTHIPTADVPDIDDLDYPSLEEVIVKAEQNRIMANAKKDKERTLATLQKLTEEFEALLKRNEELPASQRLTEQELELDPRITDDLNEQLNAEMSLVHKKFAYDLEKSELRLKKLMDHFVEPITCLPFVVKKILNPSLEVHSLRELKLTGDYVVDKSNDSEDLQQDDARPSNDQQSLSLLDSARTVSTFDSSDHEGDSQVYGVESFLKGLSPETIQFHLGDEINQLLKKYRSLKNKLEEQEQEWKILQAEKPDSKAVNPEDEKSIEHAKTTVGDYKLKVLLDAEANNRPTVDSKYKQIIRCRRQIHRRREDFNDKLRRMRTRKLELQGNVEISIKRLKKIQAEIPDKLAKPMPNLPAIDVNDEFPEKNLELEPYVPTSERVLLTKKKRMSSLLPMQEILEVSDEEYEVLLLDESRYRPDECFACNIGDGDDRQIRTIECYVPPEFEAALRESDNIESKLERDMKRARLARKIWEQDEILRQIETSYDEFDAELDELERERLDVVCESVYMDLHLLTMHQELIVLRKFEGAEIELAKRIDEKTEIVVVVERKIEKLTRKIEEKSGHVTKLREKIKESTEHYLSTIAEDKYYGYLKTICKRKYKPPRADDASSTTSAYSSSSSESSSNELPSSNDEGEKKFTKRPSNEDVCPVDCDRALYDGAFVVREARYAIEQKIRDQRRGIGLLTRETDEQGKRRENAEMELMADREELRILMREKQKQLNDVDVTVLMKLDQLRMFTDDNKSENIQNCVIFDKNKLARLYARVGELDQETSELLERHKNDKVHLHRIKLDCESMKNELDIIKEQMKKEMEQKFGRQVSLMSLYEAVLKRLIYNIKANTGSLMKFYDDKIKAIKSEYKEQVKVLKDLIQENTEKLSFLTVLEDELFKLRKLQKFQLIPETEIDKIESQYEADLKKLRAMLENQSKEKKSILKDIEALRTKTKCLPPPERLKLTTRKEEFGKKECDRKKKITEKSKESTSADFEDEVITIDDTEHYKKVIAIRHLLSQISAADNVNTKETIEKMLREVINKLKKAGYCSEEIEKNISDIIQLSDEEEEISQISGLFSRQSLADLIHQCDAESKEDSLTQEIDHEVDCKLRKLFSSLGIYDETENIALTIVNNLKTTGDVTTALKYMLDKLPSSMDCETKTARHEQMTQTLIEIAQHIKQCEGNEQEIE